jgi:hypothetical protein
MIYVNALANKIHRQPGIFEPDEKNTNPSRAFTPLTAHFYQFIVISSQKQLEVGIND